MKKRIIACIVLITIAVIALCTTITAFDGNDYDYGGWDDWGWDDDDDWGWDDDDDDYYYSGGSSGSSGSYGSGGASAGYAGAIAAILIIVFTILRAGKMSGRRKRTFTVNPTVRPGQGMQGRNVFLPNRNDQIQAIIRKKDPNFTADDFVTFAKQVYIDIQTAWCNRDLTPVRPVMHQNLYNTTQRQVQDKINQQIVYHYENMAINTAYLTSFARDKDYEYLTVYLNARMIDYQTHEPTGNIIRGDKTTRWDMRYKLKFIRTVGVSTRDKVSGAKEYNCPNCGAPLEITSAGVCSYCGSTVSTGDYSWVLTDFTTVRDDTVDDGIRVPPEDLQ